jgi:hypothetical protein
LIAAMHPARPPPMTKTSVSTGIIFISIALTLLDQSPIIACSTKIHDLLNDPRIWNGVMILIAPLSPRGQ